MDGIFRNRTTLGLLALLVFAFCFTRIADYDFWWHLNLGKSIWATGTTHTPDSFSYTFSGASQFNGEWFGDLLIYLVFSAGEYAGVNTLKWLIILFSLFFMLKAVDETHEEEAGNTWFLAGVVTLIVVLFSIRFRLFIRPYLFSYLFLALSVYVINRYDLRRNPKILLLLPLVEVFWVNTSKGAFYGPLLLILYFVATVVRKRPDRVILVAIGVTVAASLLNTEGYRIYSFIVDYVNQGKAYNFVAGENQPMSLQMLWGFGWRYTLAYQILVAGSLAYFIFLQGWRNTYHLLLFCAFFAASLFMVRMIDFFSLIATLFFVRPLAWGLRRALWGVPQARLVVQVGAPVMIVAVMLCSVPGSRTYAFGAGAKEENNPEGALEYLERMGLKGTIFNSYPFGGYIPWHSPEKKVFIDGRGVHLYSADFHKEYYKLLHSEQDWKAAEEKWKFDIAVLEYEQKTLARHFPRHLVTNPGWALVYWDDHSAVYLKRTEANRQAIEAGEYRVARPNLYDFAYLDDLSRRYPSAELLAQLDREIALNPANQEPRLAKVFLLYSLNNPSLKLAAINELRGCLSLKPDLAMEHSAMATLLLEQGDGSAADAELRKALKLDPRDKQALTLARERKMRTSGGYLKGLWATLASG